MDLQPFHEGELAVQERAGERDLARRHGTIISSRIVPGALPFLAQQRLVAVSVAGDDKHLWTTVWCGEPGFVRSADGQRVSLLPALMAVAPDDPVLRRLAVGRDVGLLAIEFASRRRLRINGTIDGISPEEITVRVRESVPNCPKYIRRRQPHDTFPDAPRQGGSARGRELDEQRRAIVERADTAFVGSLHPARGVDASHRGGPPGFITVVDSTTLRVPDYPGNSMFMTLGNFEVDPRAGLAVVDFERGSIVAFSGSARVHVDVESRYWDFMVREWVQVELPSELRWEPLEK
jgi:predicted pyridoxine 5'-phosphate oxidase superfamily flavin-nucleotide-binding protein